MTRRLLNQEARRALDLQLDAELQETFPASDPLKITRFEVAIYEPHLSMARPANNRTPLRSPAKRVPRP